MKVVVVGGMGSMGQAVVRDLTKQEIFDNIVVADIAVEEGRIPEKLKNDRRIHFEKVDIYEREKLVDLFNEAYVVVNCAGPFYKTAIPVVKAAIEAKVNYIDICDDYEATWQLLSSPDIDEDAKKANVTVLTGMGSDPGTNNILVKWYSEKMEVVEDVYLYWVVSIAEISGAAMDHSLHMIIGKVPQYLDGKLEYVEGGEGEETLDFLPPLNQCTVRFVGHPQPLTIPRYLKGVRNVVIKGGLIPKWVDEYIIMQKEMGLLERDTLNLKGVKVEPYDFTLALWDNILKSKEKGPLASGLKVVVRGKRKNLYVEYTADIAGRMAPGTGIPAAIAAGMMAKGEIKEKGVFAPEGCVDPKLFLSEFVKRGAKIYETVTEKKIVELDDIS